ncbi:choice-of-anchor Q domain-containing protein [Wenzhouxiangella marina]|uniref:Uncharacterized protein n=1 Tax=Wenzhouxiangella marina TaxID=1579979 RepID=A0A0K0XZW8_9GAMM|nr:choice-of-anchor Q domain-containing protein [Wenzhouxiangella marina]AKS43200.1 hypothetical protein WM2015_2843 [Wenzhouxiangella marina]MBB6087114.1 CSLREA domain-containing protein [Wenzhouxiangella marina]
MNKYQARQLPLTVAVSSVLAAGSLQAATITVDSLNDGPLGSFPAECTLRAAIAAANTDVVVDGCAAGEPGLDQIEFDPVLNESVITIATADSPFVITDSVQISGPVPGPYEGILIDGGGISRVFGIEGTSPGSIDVSMASLGIENGFVGMGFDDELGAGIASDNANLSLSYVSLLGHYAYYGHSGIDFANGSLTMVETAIRDNSTGYFGVGGGLVVTAGTLDMAGGVVRDNFAAYDGAGMTLRSNSTAYITGAQIRGNSGQNYFGGRGAGINVVDSTVTIDYCDIRNNGFASGGSGGGIAATGSQVTIIDSVIRNNSLGYYLLGGGTGAGLSLINSSLEMDGVQVTGNSTDSYYTSGGGIAARSSNLVISNSAFVANAAYSSSPLDFGSGGGAFYVRNGSMTIRDTEISDNLVSGDYQRASMGRFIDHDLALSNVTISGNEITGPNILPPDVGALIHMTGTSTVEFVHVTLAENTDTYGTRVLIHREPTTTLELINSVLTSPGAAEVCNTGASTTVSTLVTDVSCTGAATAIADLALGPLALNGGLTQTQALGLGSVAIDAGGDCATDLGVLTDQRGVPRDAQCDLGAFEFADSLFQDRFETLLPP